MLAVCHDFGIENDIIPHIASYFGGGIGNTGSVCGAVAGAVMAIGLIKKRGETLEDWFRVAKVVREFRRRFEAEMDTINCSELTGYDLSTEKGLEEFMSSETSMTVCVSAVGVAYRLVTDLLKETP